MGMSISMKKDTRKTNIKHNNRTFNEKEKKENSHVDFSRSHENKYLVTKSLKALYKNEFGKAQTDYNEKQKRADRKINNYYEHIQQGKKTSLQQEMILQVGDKDDFKDNPGNHKIANEVLEEWFQKFEERNPNLKVYNAVIHNDEASPHMHLNFVPVATGYKRGMDKQVSFDKAILQQDKTLNKERPFDDWRSKEVLLLEKMLKERGVERELVGTNDFKDVNDLKVRKDQVRELDKQIEEGKQTLQEFVKAVEVSKSVESIPFTTGGLVGRKNVKLVLTDFEYLKAVANASEGLKMRNTSLQLDKGLVNMQNHELKAENVTLKAENEKLRIENTRLEKLNSGLEKTVRYLKDMIELIKKNSEKFLGVAKGEMGEYVGLVRGNSLMHEFTKTKSVDLLTVVPEDEKVGASKFFAVQERKEKEKEKEVEAQKEIEKQKLGESKKKQKEVEHER